MGGRGLKVECYSGHTHAERPSAVYIDEMRVQVIEILKEWMAPDGRHFRLALENNEEIEIWYDENKEEWKRVDE